MLLAIIITALISSALTAIAMYAWMVHPSGIYVSGLQNELDDLTRKVKAEERLTSDLTSWVQIETRDHPKIWRAVEQRIKERLAQMP